MLSNELLDEVFGKFVDYLQDRFSRQIYTTEDSIRYTFFHSLVGIGGISPSEIVLEHPHPRIPGAEIDAFLPRENLVFEFKYDREIPSGRNLPRPRKAGKVFADIFRLLTFSQKEEVRRFFVYVTDREMFSYYQNRNNGLYDFFNLMPKNRLRIGRDYVDQHCRTFVKSAGKTVGECEILSHIKTNLKKQIWIRIYEVVSIPN
jgi:hypothetical protein